jgi:hypothetical protein
MHKTSKLKSEQRRYRSAPHCRSAPTSEAATAPAALPRRVMTSARQMGHTRLLRSHESTHAACNPCSQPGITRHRSPAWNASRHTAQSPATAPALLSSWQWHGSSPSSSADSPSAALAPSSSSRGAAPERPDDDEDVQHEHHHDAGDEEDHGQYGSSHMHATHRLLLPLLTFT